MQKIIGVMLVGFFLQWFWGGVRVYALTAGIEPDVKVCSHQNQGFLGEEQASWVKQNKVHLIHNSLRAHEEWIILNGLDSLCGDTWCEGSFDFQFESFKCSFGEQKCFLSWTSVLRGDTEELDFSFDFMCKMAVGGREELFGNEAHFWIAPDLYFKVSSCIEESEISAWAYYDRLKSLP